MKAPNEIDKSKGQSLIFVFLQHSYNGKVPARLARI